MKKLLAAKLAVIASLAVLVPCGFMVSAAAKTTVPETASAEKAVSAEADDNTADKDEPVTVSGELTISDTSDENGISCTATKNGCEDDGLYITSFFSIDDKDGSFIVNGDDETTVVYSVTDDGNNGGYKVFEYTFDEDEIIGKMTDEEKAEYKRITDRIAEIDELASGGKDDITDEELQKGYEPFNTELDELYSKLNELLENYCCISIFGLDDDSMSSWSFSKDCECDCSKCVCICCDKAAE